MGIFNFFKKEPIRFKNITTEQAFVIEKKSILVNEIKKKFNDWNKDEIVAFANYLCPTYNWDKTNIYVSEGGNDYYTGGLVTFGEDKLQHIIDIIDLTDHSEREDYEVLSFNNHKYNFFIQYLTYDDEIEIPRKKKKQIIKMLLDDKTTSFKSFLEAERQHLDTTKNIILGDFDTDNNGIVDVIQEDVFSKLLKEHQKKIIEVDRAYIQQFVKTSTYIDDKKKNIQKIFEALKESKNISKLEDYTKILKNEVHTFNLLLYNALSMITSLLDDDMITFYQIHGSFDKLGVFNSNWENEVSEKLTNIGDKLGDLMYSIQKMSDRIVNEIGNLTYATEELNSSITNQLKQIDSSINLNTLVNSIQVYQMYKINKNTKHLGS